MEPLKDFQLPSETEEDYILSKEIKEKINEGNEIPVEVLEYMGNRKIINCIDKNNYFKKKLKIN